MAFDAGAKWLSIHGSLSKNELKSKISDVSAQDS